jgi:hypothetical protein
MIKTEYIVPGIVAIVAITVGWVLVDKYTSENGFHDKNLLEKDMKKPIVWVYINTSDINSRNWSDFMSRGSRRVINIPFLNLCYEGMVDKLKEQFRFEVIGGLEDLAVRLGGWEALPTPLQNPLASVRAPELNWIRAAVLKKWGGLWVSPATIWLKPLPKMPKDKVVFFGTNPDPTYATMNDSPALDVIWSPKPEHPIFIDWEAKVRSRLERYSGGAEFRHDELADAIDAIKGFKEDVNVVRLPEISRKGANRRRIELEDLLASGTEGNLTFDIPEKGLYVPIPYDEILEREKFGWFLRMSEEQILESDLAISYLFNKSN